MDLGKLIKKERQAKDLTIAELARKSGISRPYISQIENGSASAPSEQKLKKIAVTLGLPFVSLLALANKELYSDEYVQESLDYSEIWQKVDGIHETIQKIINEEIYLSEKYNFLTVIDNHIELLKDKLSEISERRVLPKYPPEIESIVNELLTLDDNGQNFIKEQIRIYKQYIQWVKK